MPPKSSSKSSSRPGLWPMTYHLVNVYKKLWKDPPCYQWVVIHYFYHHFLYRNMLQITRPGVSWKISQTIEPNYPNISISWYTPWPSQYWNNHVHDWSLPWSPTRSLAEDLPSQDPPLYGAAKAQQVQVAIRWGPTSTVFFDGKWFLYGNPIGTTMNMVI